MEETHRLYMLAKNLIKEPSVWIKLQDMHWEGSENAKNILDEVLMVAGEVLDEPMA